MRSKLTNLYYQLTDGQKALLYCSDSEFSVQKFVQLKEKPYLCRIKITEL